MKTFESSEQMERVFDEGKESVLDYADMSTLRKPGKTATKRVGIDFPVWMVEGLDAEANRLAVSRQAVVKALVDEGLARRRERRSTVEA
ncbi:type II toxin-antitoxin system BrnA family antitoxin [Thermophilibacter sp.]